MYQHAELVHWMKNKETIGIMPAQVDIDLTNICNQDCFYCNSAEHRAARPVQKKYTEYIELLDKLATWRSHSPRSFGTLHTITYPGGGEPTLLTGYEKVLEHTIDLGFLTSITTNGSHLNDLLDNVSAKKIQRLAWIGIDIDAGSQEKYEQIRHSLTKHSLFPRVIENAKNLVAIGARVDFKALLNDLNSDESSLQDLFLISQQVGVRQLYLRPTILNGRAYDFSSSIPLINMLSEQYKIPVKFNLTKNLTRNYTRCHQMYQFPVFCADGEIYTCCDNKGNSKFSIGRWDQDDFRDLWLSERHHSIYNSTDTRFCPHCRPNSHNIGIQDIIDNDSNLEQLYT
jgi:sulfatase maturation enzyme AslB (radical SAM superfamily)